MRKLDYAKVEKNLVTFIQDTFEKAGFKKAVIGLSGGIDSAISAALLVKALGKDYVTAINMPYEGIEKSGNEDVSDAKKISEHLGIKCFEQDITDAVDSFSTIMGNNIFFGSRDEGFIIPEYMRLGNIMARVRMITLFDYSSANHSLVVGTENKTEGATDPKTGQGGFGYFTLWGDAASCIEPICELYKVEIFELAKYLGLPQFIIDKKPSARLWLDHEDEKEMGIEYKDADPILNLINENQWTTKDFEVMNNNTPFTFDVNIVNRVFELKKKGAFKSTLPVHCPKNLITSCEIF